MCARWEVFAVYLVLAIGLCCPVMAFDYPSAWNEVKKAKSDGLPKTAVEKLEPIISAAVGEKNFPEALNSICEKIVQETNIQGNKAEEKITRLEAVVGKPEMAPVKPLLQLVLARWYWHFFQQNNWRFLNRSATAGLDEKDFTTWDLPKLFAKIASLYDEVLSRPDELKQIPISQFKGFLDFGNQPESYRPTLFDFACHQALEFYTCGEQASAQPENSFEIEDSSPALGDVSEFMKWKPATEDKDSHNLKALQIYQNLLTFHHSAKSIDSFIHNDLMRLGWAKSVAVGVEVSKRYLERTEGLAEEYRANEQSSTALAMAARENMAQSSMVKAFDQASEGAKRFPQSAGGIDCQSIVSSITAKSLSIVSERVAGNPLSEIKVNYRNIDQVHFRLVPYEWRKTLQAGNYDSDQLPNDDASNREFGLLLNTTPAAEWSMNLPPTPDYIGKTATSTIPQVPAGFYYLVASWRKDFAKSGTNCIQYTGMWVSSLSMVTRSNNGKVDGFVTDNETGYPIPDAKVAFYSRKYVANRYEWKLKGTISTDKFGWFSKLCNESDYEGYLIVINARNEFLINKDLMSAFRDGIVHQSEQSFLFTDRSIYRPGQTINFKGIAVAVDTELDRYEVIENRQTTVMFLDVNGQEISKVNLKSNHFGSFSGSFTAPSNRLMGKMTIQCLGPRGSTAISVEEYKRPKFKVALQVPETGAKLGTPITIKGDAIAYTGAAIDGATVKFRVNRQTQMPWWCWWYEPPKENSREITHGAVKTDRKGTFEITFTPAPDRSIPEKNEPIFTYSVSADVTDNNGETRSAEKSVRIGYTALEIGLDLPSWLESGKEFALDLRTTTLDGKGVKASGKIEIKSLKSPKTPKRPEIQRSPWEEQVPITAGLEEGSIVKKSDFETSAEGSLKPMFTLEPGAYRLAVTSKDRFGTVVKAVKDLIVSEPAGKKFTVGIPHYWSVEKPSNEPGETFRALWGSGYAKTRAWIEIERRKKIFKSYWTDEGSNQHLIEVPVTEEMRGGFIVRVYQVSENRFYQETYKAVVPWSNKNLKISFESFHPKLFPGQKETWTLKLSGPGAEMKAVEMVAALYDASLDAFAPHSWTTGFGVFHDEYNRITANTANEPRQLQSIVENWNHYSGSYARTYPQFQGNIIQNWGGYGYYRGGRARYDLNEGMAMEKSMSGAPSPSAAPMASREAEPSADMQAVGATALNAVAAPDAAVAPAKPKPAINLDKVSARANLNETAFFFPHLGIERDGSVKISFEIPEALTTWKFLSFAHGLNLEAGGLTGETVTQKDLMVQPNPPRFLREGDELVFTSKITNLSDKPLSGNVRLSLKDAEKDVSMDKDFELGTAELPFDVPAKESRGVEWKLKTPEKPGVVVFKVVASTGELSDGEEGMLPILARRILVIETIPLWISDAGEKKFTFKKLLESGNSKTLQHQSLTIQATSNPAWYAVQALPYLIEFPYECAEQTFNRLYANTLASYIAKSDPKIRRVFNVWKAMESEGGKALVSNLEKNQDLKNVVLMETPWVRQAKSETQAKHNVGILFEDNRLNDEMGRASKRLQELQLPEGAWPWFSGGRADPFITLYIMTGFGRLRHLGVTVDTAMAIRSLNYLDGWINEIYRDILAHSDPSQNHLSTTIAFYLYGRSFFLKDSAIQGPAKEAVDYFLGQAKQYWLEMAERQSQGHLALGLTRFGDATTAKKIGASIKERSVTDEELGRFWRETELSWWWYRAPIETQAVMIELFDEVMNDEKAMEECKVWLLKQKQTQDWKTTKATSDAIYALLLKGTNLLASDKLVQVTLGGELVQPKNVEAGTGYYEVRFAGSEIKPGMGDITFKKEDKGIAWGGVFWQYLEDMTKVTAADTNLKLKKTLFVKRDTSKGPVIEPVKGPLAVGDLLVIRIELRTDRDMEYVHMKDQRGCGLEPIETISGYRYQDGLAYYQTMKDTAAHFFIDYLPKGTYVFEYNLRVQHKGAYQTGIAEIQCMYAPEFSSHSESFLMNVK